MRAWTLVAALFAVSHARAASEFELCTLCHGSNANGNSVIRAPKLSGLDAEYLERQLRAFRSGVRGSNPSDISGGEMRTIALSLSEAAVGKAAQFVAHLKAQPAEKTLTGDVTRGQALFASCASCHGAQGEGNRALKAPNIVATNDWYLVVQLANYRNGIRGTGADSDGTPMRAAALALPDAEAFNDIAAYLNTLR